MNLRDDIIRLSDVVLAEARAAGLNPGGRLMARRGIRAAASGDGSVRLLADRHRHLSSAYVRGD